ncbi:hypothetical protein JCM8547_003254 [Rhodosporidiobolus lusitaniae]
MEKVQLALERFLPELRDLEQKGVFNKNEISDIVSKRRGFEMGLAQGRGTKPLDYLRYIEYERRLEKLRRARLARITTENKHSLSDYSISAHITQLHRLAVRRFPQSLAMWDAFIAHSLTQASPLLVSRTLSSAIAMHPTHTAYWIMASQWESEGDRRGMGGGNTEAARRLCMRALRFLKGKRVEGKEGDEEAVWKEWIRLEVAFVEKLRGRMQVLGIGKGVQEDIVRVKEKKVGEDEEEEEEEDAGVAVPTLEGEAGDDDEAAAEVDAKVLSGQEAILDGAIVRLVIDNLLKSYDYSTFAYQLLLSILRPLPSPLRLPLLQHVYTTLSSSITPSSPFYPAALHILATRRLYDVPYVPPKSSKKRKADEAEVAEPEDLTAIKVKGEKLVDAVGQAAEEYWKVLKGLGKKSLEGKGQEQEGVKAQEIWEKFCGWLEEMADEVENEDLLEFLSANFVTALSSAPQSPFLSLLHLRHLLRTGSPPADVLAHAQKMTKAFGSEPTPAREREQVWVARLETAGSLSSTSSSASSDLTPLFTQATRSLPFSTKLWDLFASFTEETAATPSAVETWYTSSIRRVLLTNALPPASFSSAFVDPAAAASGDDPLPPRELLPRRFVHYLTTVSPADFHVKLSALLISAPSLSLSFLSSILDPSSPAFSSSASGQAGESALLFRQKIHERILAHPEAGVEEWLAYAEEAFRTPALVGGVGKAQDVLRRARGRLGLLGEGEVSRFDAAWERVCARMEQ